MEKTKLLKMRIPLNSSELIPELTEFFTQKGYEIVSHFIKKEKEFHFVIRR